MNRAEKDAAASASWTLLATAIARRRLVVRLNPDPDGLTFCDGTTITIGGVDDWRSVVAQSALVAAGSLAPAIVGRLLGRPGIARRYCAVEVPRALAVVRDRLPGGIDTLAAILPGPSSPAEALALAVSRRPLPDPPAWFGVIRPLAVLRHPATREAGSHSDAADPAPPVAAAIVTHDDDREQEDSVLLRLLQNPFARRNTGKSLLGSLMGAASSTGQAGLGSVDDSPVGRIMRVLRRRAFAVPTATHLTLPDVEIAVDQSFRLPEWDDAIGRYRYGWVLGERVEPAADIDADRPVEGNDDTDWLVQQFAGIGLAHRAIRGETDGSDLDTGGLIAHAIDRRLGRADGVPRVYRATRRRRRDLIVAIALDVSGSTADTDGDGVATFERHRAAAVALTSAFDRLDARVSAFGFQSWGRKLFRVLHLKSADERHGGAVRDRFARLEPVGFTRLGAAIRYGARMLADKGRAGNTVLLVITDGVAFDEGYELARAIADVQRAVADARTAGIACIALSLGRGADAGALETLFGTDIATGSTMRDAALALVARTRTALHRASRRRDGTHANSC